MFYIYILESLKSKQYYIGQTNSLEKRIKDHNRGKDHSSKIGLPWKLKTYKICATRSEAMILERKLKNLKSREKLNNYIAGWSSS